MQVFLKLRFCVQYRGGGAWLSADLSCFTSSSRILAVPCQDEEGNLDFPSEMGGAEALWCSELQWALLGWAGRQRAPGKPGAKNQRCHAGVLGEKVGIGWEEQAEQTRAGQNECFKITKGFPGTRVTEF